MRGTFNRLALAAVVAAAIVTAAGCGSSNDNSTSSTGGGGGAKAANLTATPGINLSEDSSVSSQVPSDVKSSGTLTVATDPTYAPDEFIKPNSSQIIGMDVDMANALAQVMGLKSEMKNATFDSIIPGLAANKFDLGMSSFTVTKEREKTVDFVTYLSAGSSFYVAADGGPDIQTLDDLCGHSVAVERGTIQATDATNQDKKCKAGGKPGVTLHVFPDQNGANLAISSGRDEVGIADSPVAAYIVAQSGGQFKLSGKSYDSAPYGIAIPKGGGLTDPVAAAMQKVIDDGAYQKILDYWGLTQSAISKAEVNPTNVPAS